MAMCAGVVFITLRTNCERQRAGRSRLNLMMLLCLSQSQRVQECRLAIRHGNFSLYRFQFVRYNTIIFVERPHKI